jgi:hypothetical protein
MRHWICFADVDEVVEQVEAAVDVDRLLGEERRSQVWRLAGYVERAGPLDENMDHLKQENGRKRMLPQGMFRDLAYRPRCY